MDWRAIAAASRSAGQRCGLMQAARI